MKIYFNNVFKSKKLSRDRKQKKYYLKKNNNAMKKSNIIQKKNDDFVKKKDSSKDEIINESTGKIFNCISFPLSP